MKIKIKHFAKWFIYLFPFILLFIHLTKNNFSIDTTTQFYGFLNETFINNYISKSLKYIVEVFVPFSDLENPLEIALISCFTWLIQIAIFWFCINIADRFFKHLTKAEEE